jgi:hypothetical protein
MRPDLIELRKQALDRADRALEAAWPARLGDDYVREMLWAVGQLEAIAGEMQAKDFDQAEQSRTYNQLGTLYADLGPALGKEMLLKARKSYQVAETLLAGQPDDLERAKLNFNFANTLRQIDPNNMEQLQEAKQRGLAARAYFAGHAPQYLAQVDAVLKSVENLLQIAPLANAVRQNTDDMAALQKQLAEGGDINEITAKAKEVMKRGGGAAGMVGQLQTIIETLPEDQRQSSQFADIREQMQGLTKKALGNDGMTPEVKQIWSTLNDRLKAEAAKGAVSKDRAESLGGLMEELDRILSGDEKDNSALLSKLQKMREFFEGKLELTHYLSHGIPRPPAGSRAADLVELNWQLRHYLMEEMNRPEKGEEESKEALDLSMRAARVDKRIYEAGADDALATTVEKEELRPLALAVRNFSARMHSMPAKPVWHSAKVAVDSNAVFYSGSAKWKGAVAAVCRRPGLEMLAEPRGESYASARWKQLQMAFTTVFDLRVEDGPSMAAVTYELGIALTLGKPVVVLVGERQTMPFDVDIDPVVLAGGPADDAALASAIDRSTTWTYPRPLADASPKTLEYVISRYPRPQQNVYVDQTLRMLSELSDAPDPVAITRTLVKFFDYMNDGVTMVVQPWWLPAYPEGNKLRLFHVMPFRPPWADQVTANTRETCRAVGVSYVRGDEMDDPNVIRSIWEEIARATHILVDLTGFNANVALELGISHTLGKKVLLVGQGDPKEHVFESISRFRVQSYDTKQLDETLRKEVIKFISTN